MFLSRIDSSNIRPANGGTSDQLIPMAKQVCAIYQQGWGNTTTPALYNQASTYVSGNSPGLSGTDVGAFIGISQTAYCPWSMKG